MSCGRAMGRFAGLIFVAVGMLGSVPGIAQTTGGGSSPGLQVVDTGLPVVQIWTDGNAPILDRENYVGGSMKITDGSRTVYATGLYDGRINMKGRGNSSWDMPKKGYRLKLPAAAQILDMPADKDWVLIANYADKTLMRNVVGFELSRRFGLAWTPRMRYVEFYLNGEFLGNYLLGEHVKVAPQRVNVTKLTTSDADQIAPNVTGGYLIEADPLEYVDPGDVFFYLNSEQLFDMKDPDSPTSAQLNYISAYAQSVEDAIIYHTLDNAGGYESLIDVDTFINWYLVKELMKDVDGGFYSSVYLYKERNAKLAMGPVWDFDLAAGNVDYSSAQHPTGWYIRTQSEWFRHLFKDPVFAAKVRSRWKSLKSGQIDTIFQYIDQTKKLLNGSEQQNFTRWPILNEYVWPNAVVTGSYPKEVDYLKNWLKTRINWMDQQYNK
jgi:hypothetical protein